MTVAFHNPLNLTWRPQDKWVGLATPPNEGRFCSFVSPQDAFRAYTIELRNHIHAGINTVPKFIKTWSATDQDAYIVNVLRWGHFGASQVLTVNDALPLFRAMCEQEDGSDPYPDSVIQEGIDMATNAPKTTMANVMAQPATQKLVTGGGAAAFIAMELAKFNVYTMSPGETVALGVILTILLHRLFPQGLSVE